MQVSLEKGVWWEWKFEYRHPAEQTREEEGRVEWSGKRYMQLTVVVPALEKAMREGSEKAKKRTAAGSR